MVAAILLATAAASAPSTSSCPPAPPGFTRLPSHCVGSDGSCSKTPLKSGDCSPDTVAACFAAAARECETSHECNSFAILAGGGASCTVSHAGPPRWHIYSETIESADANNDWVAYAKNYTGPPTPAPTPGVGREISCAMRKLAATTAAKRIGAVFGAAGDAAIADALRLQDCPGRSSSRKSNKLFPTSQSLAPITVHISPTGDDSTGDGSAAKPYRSPTRARDAIRFSRQYEYTAATAATIIVHDGTYYLGAMAFKGPLHLDVEDGSTAWVAAPGAMPLFSGAVDLSALTWAPVVDPAAGLRRSESSSFHRDAVRHIYVADVSKIAPFAPPSPLATSPPPSVSFASAFDTTTGTRLTRARTPNGNAEVTSGLCFMGSNLLPSEGCSSFMKKPQKIFGGKFVAKTVKTVRFNTTRGGVVPGDDIYREYHVVFQAPPASYPPQFKTAVCNQGEGGGELYNRSSGMHYDASTREMENASEWTRQGNGGVLHMMHNGWGNVQFLIDAVNASSRAIKFAYGGFQHGRSGSASLHWIENVKELLDAPGEWYLDEPTQKLYLWPNATTSTSSSSSSPRSKVAVAMSGAVLESVVVVNGSRTSPVRDVSFHGIGFGHTAPTYLAPHERPISGDWGIQRGGTVSVTNAANISFTRCRWNRTGGNGLLFSRWVKNSSVTESEFVSLGDSAIVAYGDVDWATGDAHGPNAPGYPSGLVIQRNLIHEIGVWGKQTSCFFQGISGRNVFKDNVCFNGPRALVNINDGLLGLSVIEGNVLFNGCRESDDHGNFNSWDRTPLLHLDHDSWGSPSWSPGVSIIRHNLLQNSYGAGHGIDHDDGSNFWNDVENVVCFSHACKGNFGSNRNCSANLVIAPGLKDAYGTTAHAGAPCATESNNGHGSTFAKKYFESNTCAFIASGTNEAYSFEGCRTSNASGAEMGGSVWETKGNTYFVRPGSSVVAKCGKESVPLEEWQAKYHQDSGGRVRALPSTETLVKLAKALLG